MSTRTEFKGVATSIRETPTGWIGKYHATDIIEVTNGIVTLNSGGFRTVTTKRRLNAASLQFELGYNVYQRNHVWYVDFNGKTEKFEDGMQLTVKRVIPTLTREQIVHYHAGEKVYVYFNLHKKLWSVKSRTTGRVLFHCESITLIDVIGKVSEAGRQRVIREGRKNVHAGLSGTITAKRMARQMWPSRQITYNPYKYDSFVYADNEDKFTTSDYVELNGREVHSHKKYISPESALNVIKDFADKHREPVAV